MSEVPCKPWLCQADAFLAELEAEKASKGAKVLRKKAANALRKKINKTAGPPQPLVRDLVSKKGV